MRMMMMMMIKYEWNNLHEIARERERARAPSLLPI